jgi:hypothetical protein
MQVGAESSRAPIKLPNEGLQATSGALRFQLLPAPAVRRLRLRPRPLGSHEESEMNVHKGDEPRLLSAASLAEADVGTCGVGP